DLDPARRTAGSRGAAERRRRRDPRRAAPQCRRPRQGRARHADPARRPGDLQPAQHPRTVAGRGRRGRHAVHRRLRLHGRQDPRREEGGDRQRRPRLQHRPASGVQRGGARLPRRPAAGSGLMAGRLAGKMAVVVGAGQTPGETIGNGRATAILFAREGATVMCVDRRLASAEETAQMIAQEGGQATAYEADITKEADCEKMAAEARARMGRIDILHNNVGIGLRDRSVTRLEEADFDRIMTTNLKGMWLTIKHVLPVMRDGGGGAIVNISSMAAVASSNLVAYGMSKAGVNKLTHITAAGNAQYMIRCNCIMPGLMDTPMAVGGRAAEQGRPTDEIRAGRDSQVPLGRKM